LRWGSRQQRAAAADSRWSKGQSQQPAGVMQRWSSKAEGGDGAAGDDGVEGQQGTGDTEGSPSVLKFDRNKKIRP
jgi:hypothetical protein